MVYQHTHAHGQNKIISHTNTVFNVWKRFAARDNDLIYIQIPIRTSQMQYVRIGISSQHSCYTHTTTHTHTANYAMWHGCD